MKAMILAAGRGERMRELTKHMPKPLLRIGDNYLIEYAINSLKQAGFFDIVINVSYFAEDIEAALGDGKHYGVEITYSYERERLETGGGIFQALPLLGNGPFLVMSSDIITDYPLETLKRSIDGLAHLVMVDNPSYHLEGDYGIEGNLIKREHALKYTFANIGVYQPELFLDCKPEHFRLTKVLNPAIDAGKVSGEVYQGAWFNIGSPEDIIQFEQHCI